MKFPTTSETPHNLELENTAASDKPSRLSYLKRKLTAFGLIGGAVASGIPSNPNPFSGEDTDEVNQFSDEARREANRNDAMMVKQAERENLLSMDHPYLHKEGLLLKFQSKYEKLAAENSALPSWDKFKKDLDVRDYMVLQTFFRRDRLVNVFMATVNDQIWVIDQNILKERYTGEIEDLRAQGYLVSENDFVSLCGGKIPHPRANAYFRVARLPIYHIDQEALLKALKGRNQGEGNQNLRQYSTDE